MPSRSALKVQPFLAGFAGSEFATSTAGAFTACAGTPREDMTMSAVEKREADRWSGDLLGIRLAVSVAGLESTTVDMAMPAAAAAAGDHIVCAAADT